MHKKLSKKITNRSLLKSKRLNSFLASQNFSKLSLDAKNLFLKNMPHKLSHIQLEYSQALFLQQLVLIAKPKSVIEIGTFLGFSARCLACQLAKTASLTCLEVNSQYAKIAKENLKNCPAKVIFEVAPAHQTLQNFQSQNSKLNNFDLAFIDADKSKNYKYFELLLPLMQPGGVILIDNALPAKKKTKIFDSQHPNLELITKIWEEPQVLPSLLSIGAGFLMAVKL